MPRKKTTMGLASYKKALTQEYKPAKKAAKKASGGKTKSVRAKKYSVRKKS